MNDGTTAEAAQQQQEPKPQSQLRHQAIDLTTKQPTITQETLDHNPKYRCCCNRMRVEVREYKKTNGIKRRKQKNSCKTHKRIETQNVLCCYNPFRFSSVVRTVLQLLEWSRICCWLFTKFWSKCWTTIRGMTSWCMWAVLCFCRWPWSLPITASFWRNATASHRCMCRTWFTMYGKSKLINLVYLCFCSFCWHSQGVFLSALLILCVLISFSIVRIIFFSYPNSNQDIFTYAIILVPAIAIYAWFFLVVWRAHQYMKTVQSLTKSKCNRHKAKLTQATLDCDPKFRCCCNRLHVEVGGLGKYSKRIQ